MFTSNLDIIFYLCIVIQNEATPQRLKSQKSSVPSVPKKDFIPGPAPGFFVASRLLLRPLWQCSHSRFAEKGGCCLMRFESRSESGKKEIFCPFVHRKDGSIAYPKNSRCFHFFVKA